MMMTYSEISRQSISQAIIFHIFLSSSSQGRRSFISLSPPVFHRFLHYHHCHHLHPPPPSFTRRDHLLDPLPPNLSGKTTYGYFQTPHAQLIGFFLYYTWTHMCAHILTLTRVHYTYICVQY